MVRDVKNQVAFDWLKTILRLFTQYFQLILIPIFKIIGQPESLQFHIFLEINFKLNSSPFHIKMFLLKFVLRSVIAISWYNIWVKLHIVIIDQIFSSFKWINVCNYTFWFWVKMTNVIDFLRFFDGFHYFDFTFWYQICEISHQSKYFGKNDD